MLKKKPPPSGAPEWVLTYGDMMSLLLCFFILLAAFADYEEGGSSRENFDAAIESIHQTLGIRTAGGNRINPTVEFNALIQELRRALQRREEKTRGDTTEVGLKGRHFRMRRIRDGMEITIGGPVLFAPFSSELLPGGSEMIADIARVVRGHRNRIDIRGHAADDPPPPGWTWDDSMQLAYTRAKHVGDELIALGVDRRAIRLISSGPNEPIRGGLYPYDDPGQNRRVEIIIRESLIDDYLGQAPTTAPATTQPGP